jgi:hypothetical protein
MANLVTQAKNAGTIRRASSAPSVSVHPLSPLINLQFISWCDCGNEPRGPRIVTNTDRREAYRHGYASTACIAAWTMVRDLAYPRTSVSLGVTVMSSAVIESQAGPAPSFRHSTHKLYRCAGFVIDQGAYHQETGGGTALICLHYFAKWCDGNNNCRSRRIGRELGHRFQRA